MWRSILGCEQKARRAHLHARAKFVLFRKDFKEVDSYMDLIPIFRPLKLLIIELIVPTTERKE
jgi:hypothetical protein